MKVIHHYKLNALQNTPLANFYNLFYIYDRTQTILKNNNLCVLSPLKKPNYKTYNIDEICYDRVISIYNKIPKSSLVHIMWSGGIDSTVTLVSFLKYFPDKERLIIFSNFNESIKENPNFYFNFIENKVKCKKINSLLFNTQLENVADNNDVVITGEIGDQIFGSDNYFKDSNFSKLNLDWKDCVSEKYIDVFEKEHCSLNPFYNNKTVNYRDFLWWNNFTLKYQNVQLRIILSGITNMIVERNIFHFFDCELWQQYAINTPNIEKMPGDATTYKMPLKKFIYEFDKDKNYFLHKQKEPSLKNTNKYVKKNIIAIDENWKFY